ncbi:MAG: flavodoxin-dependent (E)-4-hydroxy-3-methylbut-2-enyl-diphosphate synthase [Candidatus Acetothermia bacterium]
MNRNQTRKVTIGDVPLGGGHPIVVQSMANTDTSDANATLAQITGLAKIGCEVVRVAVPNQESANSLPQIVENSPIPVVADIHFDANLALASIEAGVDKLRLNPGNISQEKKVRQVAQAAKESDIPIRVGVNSGSLSQEIRAEFGDDIPNAMVESARRELEILEEEKFEDIVVSLKSSNVATTIAANRKFATNYSYPLHLGITEAGGGQLGLIKSALGIGSLLLEGIGDTIRVSLTGPPENEVVAAYNILQAAQVRQRGIETISCPTCGRTEIEVQEIVKTINDRLKDFQQPVKVAVMGCIVNGIGEARATDFGLVGTPKGAVLYKAGKKEEVLVSKSTEQLVERLEREIRRDLKPKPQKSETKQEE